VARDLRWPSPPTLDELRAYVCATAVEFGARTAENPTLPRDRGRTLREGLGRRARLVRSQTVGILRGPCTCAASTAMPAAYAPPVLLRHGEPGGGRYD